MVKSENYEAPHYTVSTAPFGFPPLGLSTELDKNILNLWPLLKLRHQFSHPYRTGCHVAASITHTVWL